MTKGKFKLADYDYRKLSVCAEFPYHSKPIEYIQCEIRPEIAVPHHNKRNAVKANVVVKANVATWCDGNPINPIGAKRETVENPRALPGMMPLFGAGSTDSDIHSAK